MGDPKKLKKKYSTPAHPWNKTAIEEERKIKKEYGLRNKQEIFRANSFLKKYKDLAKKLIAQKTAQGEKEKQQILEKLQWLGLLSSNAILDDILGLQLKDILERRLQSIIFRKGLARSMRQARQFITHRHVAVKGQELTAPSYLLSLEEENQLNFKEKSTLADEEHPERTILNKEEMTKKTADVKEEEKQGKKAKTGKAEKKEQRTEQKQKEEAKEEIKEETETEEKDLSENSSQEAEK